MLIIRATDEGNSDDLLIVHEVKNVGKLTEEHHFYVYTKGSNIDGPPMFAFVIDKEQAVELKAHI
jgi:hypothetical protein